MIGGLKGKGEGVSISFLDIVSETAPLGRKNLHAKLGVF